MNYRNHLIAGMLINSVILGMLIINGLVEVSVQFLSVAFILTVTGCLFSDIDAVHSKIRQIVDVAGIATSVVLYVLGYYALALICSFCLLLLNHLKHRGLLHHPIMGIAFFLLLLLNINPYLVLLSLSAFYSHFFLDTLS